jgi:hemolysin D
VLVATDEGQLIETDAALKELQSERAKTISQFIADNQNKLAEVLRKVNGARQALVKATARLSHTKLYAPIGGVVQQTAVTTVGQVVTTGQQLAVITPVGGKLQVEALIPNLDIGFVKPGQPAVIKVDAFPFTRFGVLHGKVEKIASAAISEHEAKRALANATASATVDQAPPTAPGQPESFVFPITVALDETAMKIDSAVIPITPGVTLSVEIKTDSRRVIDYLLSPLAKVASEAARER